MKIYPSKVEGMKAMLAPLPEHHYPVPWRLAERKGDFQIIVCADGNYVAEVPAQDGSALAELIVAAVHQFAGYENPSPQIEYKGAT